MTRTSDTIDPLQNAPRFSLATLFGLVTASAIILWLFFFVYPFGPLLAWFGASTLVAKVALQIQNRLLGFLCAVMFALGILGIPFFVMGRHAVSPNQLKRIHVGATASQVESALGVPTSITTGSTGDDWVYSGATWCYVTISFDADGIVNYIDHDH